MSFKAKPHVVLALIAGIALVLMLVRAGVPSVPLNSSIDLRAVGARGDGVTDDTSALQAAFNRAKKSKQGIYVPVGIFVFHGTLHIGDGVHLFGAGDQSILRIEAADDAIEVTGNGVTIENLQIAGRASRMIRAGQKSGTGLILRNLVISGASVAPRSLTVAGIYCDGFSNVIVEGCIIHDCGQSVAPRGHGIVFNNGAGMSKNITIRSNRIVTSNSSFGISLFDCIESNVEGNAISGSVLESATASGYGILIYRKEGSPPLTDNIVAGNRIRSTAGSGIYLNGTTRVTVSCNWLMAVAGLQSDVSLPVGGIALNESDRAIITNNHVVDSGKDGIVCVGKNAVVQGNVITDTNQYAIHLRAMAQGHIITANHIAVATVGVSCREIPFTDCLITSNSIKNCTYGGVFLTRAIGCSIIDNRFDDVGYGLQIVGGESNMIANNLFSAVHGVPIEDATAAFGKTANRVFIR